MLVREAIEELQAFEDENPGSHFVVRCVGVPEGKLEVREPTFASFFPVPGDGPIYLIVEGIE